MIQNDRAVQSRILWELQNLLREGFPEGKASPDSLTGIFLCVLSFPSVVFATTREDHEVEKRKSVSKEPELAELRQNSESVSVSFRNSSDATRVRNQKNKQKILSFAIHASCAPQGIFLHVQLLSLQDAPHHIKLRLCRQSCSKDRFFEWEWWRNSAMARIEGLRRWQESQGMHFADFDPVSAPMTSGVQRVQSPLMGGESNFLTWTGWGPFRRNQCSLELRQGQVLMKYDTSKKLGTPVFRGDSIQGQFRRIIGKRVLCQI